jgi:hypothetical protein
LTRRLQAAWLRGGWYGWRRALPISRSKALPRAARAPRSFQMYKMKVLAPGLIEVLDGWSTERSGRACRLVGRASKTYRYRSLSVGQAPSFSRPRQHDEPPSGQLAPSELAYRLEPLQSAASGGGNWGISVNPPAVTR